MVHQPPVKGNRLVILSRSGGEAVVGAYACKRFGFTLPPLDAQLADLIHESSRSKIIKPGNPIDLGDIFDFQVYSRVMEALCRDPGVDAVLLNYGPVYEPERQEAREMARHFIKTSRATGKPLAVSVCASLEEEDFFREELGVPVFHFPGQAVRGLAYSRDFWLWSGADDPRVEMPAFDTEAISALLAAAFPNGFLPMPQALALLAAIGVPVAPWRAASNRQEALDAATALGYPVVLKLAAASLVHKTEVGGVVLNVQHSEAAAAAFQELAGLAKAHLPPGEPWQVVVMRQAAGGEEVLLGASRDPSFGPVVAFGAGGIWAEFMDDLVLRVAPFSPREARWQIRETRMGRILQGARGRPSADLEALSRALSVLSHLMDRFPQIREVDLNPVMAFPGKPGLLALDARVKVG
jgi:acetyltransferase